MRVQGVEIGVVDLVRVRSHLEGKVEHCYLPCRDVCLAIVCRHLIGQQAIFFPDAEYGAVRHYAVNALVVPGRCDDDHFALTLRQSTFFFHQRIVVSKERSKFVWPVCQRQKHIGYETTLFLYLEDRVADILWQVIHVRYRVSTDYVFHVHLIYSRGRWDRE